MSQSACGIYAIKNRFNDKVYIGSSINIPKRFCQHKSVLIHGKHHSDRLQKSWNKHGENGFDFVPLFICSKNLLNFYEERTIKGFDSSNPSKGYNLSLIIDSKHYHSEATRKKLSQNHTGILNSRFGATLSQAHKAKLSWVGRHHTVETKQILREKNLGKKQSPETIYKKRVALIGMTRTPETRKRMSLAQTGRIASSATIEKLRLFGKTRLLLRDAKTGKLLANNPLILAGNEL